MVTLSVQDVAKAISAAFKRYLDQKTGSFEIILSGHRVGIDVSLVGQRFNCGMPGFNMANNDVPALKAWVLQNIRDRDHYGALMPCENVGAPGYQTGQVNAYLLAYVMFNFHVNLTHAC